MAMSSARTALVTLLEYDSFSCFVYLWKKPVVVRDGWTLGLAVSKSASALGLAVSLSWPLNTIILVE